MARRTITIPINKSSNGGTYVAADGQITTWFIPPMVSNTLYISNTMRSGYIYTNNVGLAWDKSLIPEGKIIVSTTLYIYSKYSFIRNLKYKKGEFTEGAMIPGVTTGASIIGKFTNGLNTIAINEDLDGSVLIGLSSPVDYTNSEYGELHSHRASTNKPYVVITYDDIPPDAPTSLYPSNITLNPRDIIRFSWLHNSKEKLQQKSFTLQYSTNSGSTWTTVSQTTDNQFYDMAASTLPTSGTVMWKVQTTDANDEVSVYESASFILGTVPQKAPIPISPISQYLDENKSIRFEWSFTGGSGSETQSKFELQYSINGGSTWTTKTGTTANQFYILPANTLAGGNITWRVRTYNNWNDVSPYSDNRSFTIIGSPPIPLISSVSNSSRPTINWQSQGQHIYEIQILKDNKIILDTGSIPSASDRNFKLENYLEDGNYIVKLRILNEYNLYSPWAEKSFTISTVKPSKPIIEVYSGEYSITIKVTNTSLKNLAYRDDILIGEVTDNTFVDYTGENDKEYKYFIRVVDSSDNFSDSTIKISKCKFNGNTLALANNPGHFIKLKNGFNGIPKKTNRNGVTGSLIYFDGRKKPVVEFSGFSTKEKTLSFFIKHKEELDKLKEMIEERKVFLYRDFNGENIYGSIFNVDDDKTIFGYEINFTIIETEV